MPLLSEGPQLANTPGSLFNWVAHHQLQVPPLVFLHTLLGTVLYCLLSLFCVTHHRSRTPSSNSTLRHARTCLFVGGQYCGGGHYGQYDMAQTYIKCTCLDQCSLKQSGYTLYMRNIILESVDFIAVEFLLCCVSNWLKGIYSVPS